MIFPEKYRAKGFKVEGVDFHFFLIPFRGRDLHVIASIEPDGWERCSISLKNRNPNQNEMCHVKNLLWGDDEFCIQLHPRKKHYINIHEHCLHIFKPPTKVQEVIEIVSRNEQNKS